MTRYLTLLSLKILNRSLKSELTNIKSFHPRNMKDKFPGCLKPGGGRLRLPKLDIEATIQLFELTAALCHL